MSNITTLEELREAMYKRGMTKASCNTRAVAVAFDIMTECGHISADIVASENIIKEKQKEIASLDFYYERKKKQWTREEQQAIRESVKLQREREAFQKDLESCETPEARDAMRLARVFKDSIRIDTKYDNTAYINQLGAILSLGDKKKETLENV